MYLQLFTASLVLLLVATTTGCGGDSASISESEPVPVPDPVSEDKVALLKEQVDTYVDNTLAWFTENNINCSDNAEHELCAIETVRFNDGQFEQERTDSTQTILVLDAGMNFPAVMRYRSRIKAYYQFDDNIMSFVASNPEVNISRVGKKILSELDQFQYETLGGAREPAFVPAAWLTDIATSYVQAVPDDNTDYVTDIPHSSHGSTVVNYLLEHNPEAELVLIDTASFFPLRQYADAVCNRDFVGFSDLMEDVKQSLINIINENGVDYVNYSGGFTLDSVYRDWNRNACDGELSGDEARQLLLGLTPVYEALFAQDNVLGIQSGVRGGDGLDVQSFKHRIRAASFTSESTDIALNEDGSEYWREAFADYSALFEGHETIDIFVNFGFKDFSFDEADQNSTPKMTSDVFGMRYRTDWDLHSSWAAPLVTSVAIYVNNSLKSADPAYIFNPVQIKRTLLPENCAVSEQDETYPARKAFATTGLCRIQDPLKFRRLEVHRSGYLD